MKKLSPQQIQIFRKKLSSYYEEHGRHEMPWRKTSNPYHILISEIMLQQTQVQRVTVKYLEFLAAFPTIQSLAHASLKEVLTVWSGLGYNRRAAMLKKAAEKIVAEFKGKFPRSAEALQSLPGIGNATAGQILAFAFNKPSAFIETNIRTVFIHEFFKDKQGIHDNDLLPLVAQTLDSENPRRWYYALFDYGVMLKKQHANPSRKSAHHTVQSAFEGSNRQVRGFIIRSLTQRNMNEKELQSHSSFPKGKILRNLAQLQKEGLVIRKGTRYALP